MPASHRRNTDPEDAVFVHERGNGEGDKILSWGFRIDKYFRLVLPVLTLLGGVFMATVWRPLRSIPDIQAQVQSLSAAQIKETADRKYSDSLSIIQRTQLANAQRVMSRILCFNMDRSDRLKYDIDCTDIPLPEKQ